MPCYYPLKLYRKVNGRQSNDFIQTVPCGQCIGCRLERSRQWAMRCVHESQMHKDNCFLTLTYNDDNLPASGTLVKSHMTLFIKRLRFAIEPIKIRYFQCGEYGKQTQRPHYHMILFGYDFPDKKLHSKTDCNYLYTSETLEKLWGMGHCLIGSVTFDSAAYVARYCVDKLTGQRGVEEYDDTGRIPPFVTMSRRPGIGKNWYERYKTDVFPSDEVVVSGGKTCKPPKYYDRLLEENDKDSFTRIKMRREKAAKNNPDRDDHKRLAVKETIVLQKIGNLQRKI